MYKEMFETILSIPWFMYPEVKLLDRMVILVLIF